MFVDPIFKGNYSSRLSHSCDPNCGTITTVSNGNYIIGMFALKNISYGEELTFDYCSYSEDMNECKKAICLCGSRICRGSYLEFSNSGNKLRSLEKHQPFLKRQYLIFQAGIQKKIINDSILKEFSFERNILANLPGWLVDWITSILEFIKQETDGLTASSNENKVLLSNDIKENRLQNLVISIDKIKYFLSKTKTKTQKSPLTPLRHDEIIKYLWGKPRLKTMINKNKRVEPRNVIEELVMALLGAPLIKEIREIFSFILLMDSEIQGLTKRSKQRAVILMKLVFLYLSEMIQKIAVVLQKESIVEDKGCHYWAISDILYFYSFTKCYFRAFEYDPVESPDVYIRKCELSNQQTYQKEEKSDLETDGSIVFTGKKRYESLFLWEQMTYWYKQTEISMKKEKKGVLVYPNLYESFATSNFGYPFIRSGKVRWIFEII